MKAVKDWLNGKTLGSGSSPWGTDDNPLLEILDLWLRAIFVIVFLWGVIFMIGLALGIR